MNVVGNWLLQRVAVYGDTRASQVITDWPAIRKENCHDHETIHADIGDARLDRDSLFDAHVRSSVERQLTAKGFQKVSPDSADLVIRYHENTEHKVEVLAVDSVYEYEPSYESRVIEYDEGTLILDIAEAGSKRVVWRGWARTNIDQALVDPQLMEKKIGEATQRLFERFPPVR